MWRHYVYVHRTADDGRIFYVGKGSLRTRQKAQRCDRAYSRARRNQKWQNVAAKHGLTVEIVASFATDADAQQFERSLIQEVGRKHLANLTDGGDGHSGIIASEELRQKRSIAARGRRSDAWVASIRRSRKGGGNGGVVKKGDKLPEEWKQAISSGVRGERNPMWGRRGQKHPTAKKVIDEATGRVFGSVSEAAAEAGMKMQTLHGQLSGYYRNRTTMRFA